MHLVDTEADVPNSVSYVDRILVFEWYVLRCGSKNRCEKGTMCLKWIGPRAHNMIDIPGSIVKTGGTYITI